MEKNDAQISGFAVRKKAPSLFFFEKENVFPAYLRRSSIDKKSIDFVDSYFTNHVAKFLQDRIKSWKVGALRVCTGYQFFKRKSLVRAFQPSLTLSFKQK